MGSVHTAGARPRVARSASMQLRSSMKCAALIAVTPAAGGLSVNPTQLDGCANVDTNRDGVVKVNELIAAVQRALNGC